MLTPKDIENPKRKSGYDHVNASRAKSEKSSKPWRAESGTRSHYPGEATNHWSGPRRATSREAAQDYCAYVNGGNVAPPATLKYAEHPKTTRPAKEMTEEERLGWELIRQGREQESGRPGYIYLIAEESNSKRPYTKLGFSTSVTSRIRSLQTGNPRQLHIVAFKAGTKEDERALHAKYLEHNQLGEWFKPTDALLQEFGVTLD